MLISGIEGVRATPLPPQQANTNLAAQAPAVAGGTQQIDPKAVAPTQSSAQTSDSKSGESNEREVLEKAVAQTKEFLSIRMSDLNFLVDHHHGGQLVVKLIDQSTKDVIRQIPSKEMLEIAAALEKLQGLFVRQEV